MLNIFLVSKAENFFLVGCYNLGGEFTQQKGEWDQLISPILPADKGIFFMFTYSKARQESWREEEAVQLRLD